MKLAMSVCAMVMCVVMVGCSGSSALSMNKKMAYADSGATLSAAVALDQVPVEKFDATKMAVVTMCADISKFLDDGKIGDLPVDKARQAIVDYMTKKGWTSYISLVDVIFAWVTVQQVQIDKIGADNILVIKQGLDGIARQATRARKEWVVPFKQVTVDTTKGVSMKIN